MIPHAGAMCLLDEITFWDTKFLRGRSKRFGAAGNPLRRADGSLGMACGIEIAGQAMAAHGYLLAGLGAPPRQGMLVSLRDVEIGGGPADAAEILIEVEQLMGDLSGAAYRFSVADAAALLLSGRATVVFAGGA